MKVLIVDGYNIIFSWPELAQLMEKDLEGAREGLLALLTPLADWETLSVIVVFDAGSTDNLAVEMESKPPLTILYTRKGQSADSIIEELVMQMAEDHSVTVATGDRAERDLARFLGSSVIDAAQLRGLLEIAKTEIERASKELQERSRRNRLEDAVGEEIKEILNNMRFR